MRKPNEKHLEFIRLVAGGSEQDKAYWGTVGNKKVAKNTARNKGSVLAKRYAKEIAQERERAAKMITDAADSNVIKQALKSVLTQAEVDAKLSAIINGDLIKVQMMNASGKIYRGEIAPTIADITKAIDLYNKRFGSNAPIKSQISIEKAGVEALEEIMVHESGTSKS